MRTLSADLMTIATVARQLHAQRGEGKRGHSEEFVSYPWLSALTEARSVIDSEDSCSLSLKNVWNARGWPHPPLTGDKNKDEVIMETSRPLLSHPFKLMSVQNSGCKWGPAHVINDQKYTGGPIETAESAFVATTSHSHHRRLMLPFIRLSGKLGKILVVLIKELSDLDKKAATGTGPEGNRK